MDADVLENFVTASIKLSKDPKFEKRLLPIIELVAQVRREIQHVKKLAIEFSNNIEKEYKKMVIGNDEELSFKTSVDELRQSIQEQLDIYISKIPT